ncbi:bifunctional diguanylate cyclase/phosphodiesterase [Klenkia sp. PcliD-1-E]|uniref:putative bifunctional diguanylate cyclase/phosphodiesterase n=1 Tax=Klenkia sp. PcliD-1-E TaxID=2954492 RepID=UPI0020981706|nr:bifunctional diguanylate cyclase/phosphodiesterase [Klenkia sp. PcliD-1-E]MCO7218450.1 bifunctional diguanylate cyclase/phosphodiesterase [Klenkia sp. PcliD-1-E]
MRPAPFRPRSALVAAAGVVVVVLSAVPPTRVPTVLAVSAVAAAAPLVGVVRHRPARPEPWLAVAAMLTCWGLALALAAPAYPVALALQAAGIAVAGGLFAVIFARQRRSGPQDRRRSRRETWGRRTDRLMVALVIGLALAQSATSLLDPALPWPTAFAPVDLVLVCLLLRFTASRADLGPSMRLLVAGGVTAAVYDCLCANTGVRVLGPEPVQNVVWTVAVLLFTAGSLHPGMTTAFSPRRLARLRSESARLLGSTPLLLVPVALSLLDGARVLPTAAYLATAAAVAALAIVRGAQTIRASERLARRDPLTGLANRRGLRVAFDDLVPTTADPALPVGRLAVLDLDDFKHVNDTYGHETGDHLLVAVGGRLADAIGGGGTVARSGGDEFVLLLRPAAPDVGDLLHAAFADPVALGELSFGVRASAGWVELTGASELPLALADADVALYASKDGDRGGATRFAPEQREQVLGSLALGADLRRLVSGDPAAGELVLHYQPLVALPDRRVRGCEALVRWRHPERGLLSPDTFLPVAEAQGHGAAIDAWVLREACRSALTWPDPTWTVSVNLGRSSMVCPDLAARVRTTLAATGLPAGRLHLEITEHDQLPADAAVLALHELAADGVGVALDDFGTGYTSVAYLQRYPISVLKLDRSVTGADASVALLRGLVGLADALGTTVLAEGIETDEQCARLAGLGVDAGQGWLFGRPMTADRLADLAAPVGNPT